VKLSLEVGEGTKREFITYNDFDNTTIFSYNDDAKKLQEHIEWAGEIYPKHGIEGFYLNELFV
jgi:hypothetical protein